MSEYWARNVLENEKLVDSNDGPRLVIVVAGSHSDSAFWERHYSRMQHDVFRADGGVSVVSLSEVRPMGNFLGTIEAWRKAAEAGRSRGVVSQEPSLLCMLAGEGRRLSPFTQALGNRKSALLTPRFAKVGRSYMRVADLANFGSNLSISYLRERGFRGMLVKWGDEAILPGTNLSLSALDLSGVDAVRFFSRIRVEPELAKQKDWFLIDRHLGRVVFMLARQDEGLLRARAAEYERGGCELAVNLGSIAVSYNFLDAATDVFAGALGGSRALTWDPYVWIALLCTDDKQWRLEREYEARVGKTGIHDLEVSFPGFFESITKLKRRLRRRTGRPLRVAALDFGDALWIDMGLHRSLRECLQGAVEDSSRGEAIRNLFKIPHRRDSDRNIIVRSSLPSETRVSDSIVLDSTIGDPLSTVRDGLVVGSRLGQVKMNKGGISLFSAAGRLEFLGKSGIAFRSLGREIVIPEGGRHATLFSPFGYQSMTSNESVSDYAGRMYVEPILGNRWSFDEASRMMAGIDLEELEEQWEAAAERHRSEWGLT